ncbi:hypothetical protein BKA62DRAFT_675037 [Auriculariales sp. MPI-PUGE-AT-0066]|nr:hypothetical protein BKA62DRAFT_675037 [Auriculariales sp. MPI-PUGE-AT-0066]
MVRGDYLYCPENTPVSYGKWFQLTQNPRINVCNVCYNKFVAPSNLVSAFTERPYEFEEEITCSFFVPRVKAVWRECQQRDSAALLAEYASYRGAIKDCAGLTAVDLSTHPVIYDLPSGDINDFSICGACFEDYFVSNGMAYHFRQRSATDNQRLVAEGRSFVCDVAIPMIRSAARAYKDHDWNTFVGWARGRRAAPDCVGEALVQDSRRGWTITGVDRLVICEACYMDNVAFAPLEIRTPWQPAAAKPGDWTCDFAHNFLHTGFQMCTSTKNFETFKAAATVVLAQPPCTDKGIVNGTWFVLKGDETNDAAFKMCSSCYACIFLTSDTGDQFVDRKFPEGETHLCDLRLTEKNSTVRNTLMRIARAVGTRDMEYFATYARELPTMQPCPRDSWVGGPRRLFYGTGQWAACVSCYREVIRGSEVESLMTIHGEALPAGQEYWCELYSPRMRRIFAQACEAKSLAALETAAEERRQVNKLVIAQLKLQTAQRHNQMMMQMNMYQNAMMLQGANSFAAAAGETGSRYGNDSLGWYETSAGADGAAMFRQASNMTLGMPNLSGLRAQWAAVE